MCGCLLAIPVSFGLFASIAALIALQQPVLAFLIIVITLTIAAIGGAIARRFTRPNLVIVRHE